MQARKKIDGSEAMNGCVLVTPSWCVTPMTGGGQRTGVFFSALKKIGPTRVVVVGKAIDRDLLDRCFPGHAGLVPVEFQLFQEGIVDRRERLLYRLQRFVTFSHEYGGQARVANAVRDVLREAAADAAGAESQAPVVVYRYLPTFCWADHGPGDRHEATICVDVDDRDDRARLLLIKDKMRHPAIALAYQAIVMRRLRGIMRRRLAAASLVWFAANEDLEGMSDLPAKVIPNVPYNTPGGDELGPPSAQRDVLFVGSQGYAPNSDGVRWFLRECWPTLQARHPDSRLRIVGTGAWAELGAEFPDIDGVDFVGAVEDLTVEYARARLVIAPIFAGGGSKIKVIEACAYGRPVVVTSHSARGFRGEIEALLPPQDSPRAFIAQCARFLEDNALADEVGGRLRTLQQTDFSRASIEHEIEAQIRIAAAEPDATGR